MIFNVPFNVINVANKLQVSLSDKTKAGQRMKRENVDEYSRDGNGNILIEPHPEHDFLIKSNTNHFLLSGSIKVRFEWDEDSIFQDEHVETYLDYLRSKPVGLINPDKLVTGPGFVENQITQDFRLPTWGTSHLDYEPYCTSADVLIMEDNTSMLCPMQHTPGWTFEHIDIMPGEKIISNKVGEEMYIVFGQECFTYSTDGQWTRQVIERHSTKKQVSHELEINNGSGDMCTLVRIYK
tara:strand:+ start:1670 stop:2383 length:714 start_codon:yes stop_codon:yes gene_type:complete